MLSKETIFVHYGDTAFDIEKFEYVQNCDCLPKPINGGLWASPEDSKDGWQKINSIRPRDRNFFKFKLTETAKILILNSKDTIDKLPKIPCKIEKFPIILDFEKLSIEYDVISYKFNGEMDTLLPCWDCDCILVMNPNVVCPLK